MISLYVEASPTVLLAAGMVIGGATVATVTWAVRVMWRAIDPTIDRSP